MTHLGEHPKKILRWSLGLSPLFVFLVGWQLLGNSSSPFFPPPSTWFDVLSARGWDEFLTILWATTRVFTVGLAVAVLAGIGLGLVFGRSAVINTLVSPTLEFLRAIPAPAVVPLVILFVGPGTTTLVLSVAFAALWPILLNATESARTIEPVLIDSGRTLRLSRFDHVWKIVIPAVLPGAFVGIRVALPIALVVTLLAEMLTGTSGLGGALMEAQRSYQTASAYGLLVIAGLLGLGISLVFGLLEHLSFRAWDA